MLTRYRALAGIAAASFLLSGGIAVAQPFHLMQFRLLHVGDNCSGGVLLIDGQPATMYLSIKSPNGFDQPAIKKATVRHSEEKVLIEDGGKLEAPFMTIEGDENSYALLKKGTEELGYAPSLTSRRSKLHNIIFLANTVYFRECKVSTGEYPGNVDSDKIVRSLLGINANESAEVIIYFDNTSREIEIVSDNFGIKKEVTSQITSKANLMETYHFDGKDQSQSYDKCFTELEKIFTEGKKHNILDWDQCVSWSVSGFSDSGTYVERSRTPNAIRLLSVKKVREYAGLPASRWILIETDYADNSAKVFTKVLDNEDWEPAGPQD